MASDDFVGTRDSGANFSTAYPRERNALEQRQRVPEPIKAATAVAIRQAGSGSRMNGFQIGCSSRKSLQLAANGRARPERRDVLRHRRIRISFHSGNAITTRTGRMLEKVRLSFS